MLTLTLLVLSAAGEPRVGLVEASIQGLAPPAAARLRERLVLALTEGDVAAEWVPQRCTELACLQALSASRARGCVVGVTLVKNRKGLSVDLEAVRGDAVVLQQTFQLATEQLEKSPEVRGFVAKLSQALAVNDRPVVEVQPPLEPQRPVVVEPAPAWADAQSAPSASAAPRVLAFTAAGVGLAAVGLFVAGAVVKGQLDGALMQQPVTTLTRAQAQQQADLSNGLTVGGGVGLGLAAAALTSSLLLKN